MIQLFKYDTYYPSGGMNDLEDTFGCIDEVLVYLYSKLLINESDYLGSTNYHLYDTVNKEKIDVDFDFEWKYNDEIRVWSFELNNKIYKKENFEQ